jgi:DsbC/DsbD-like thiol-disulfide interchange protein
MVRFPHFAPQQHRQTPARVAAFAALFVMCGTFAQVGAVRPAQAQVPETSQIVQGGVRPGWRQPDGRHMAALQLTLATNWKTYWRAPGDGGIPPRFDWTGSENISDVALHWPRPVVFDQSGLRSIGYADQLVLPMEFTLTDPTAPARLQARVEIGVCETVCVPVTLQLQAILRPDGGDDRAIRAALADQPRPAAALGLHAASCAIEPISDGMRVTADLGLPSLGPAEVVVFELPDSTIWISESRSERQGARLVAASDMVPPTGALFALDRSDLRITVLGQGKAAEMWGCLAP